MRVSSIAVTQGRRRLRASKGQVRRGDGRAHWPLPLATAIATEWKPEPPSPLSASDMPVAGCTPRPGVPAARLRGLSSESLAARLRRPRPAPALIAGTWNASRPRAAWELTRAP
jgi:hypothetical protein